MTIENILAAVNTDIEESVIPVKQIAEEIGKPYGTLQRELNPHDDGAKLGIMELLPIMRVTDSTRPLEHLASRMGYRLEKIDAVEPDKDSVEAELLDNRHVLQQWDELVLAAKRGDITIEEFRSRKPSVEMEIAREIQEDSVLLERELTS